MSGLVFLIMIYVFKRINLGAYFIYLSFSNLVLSTLMLFGIFNIFLHIESLTKAKGWYNPNFWPPSEYIKG